MIIMIKYEEIQDYVYKLFNNILQEKINRISKEHFMKYINFLRVIILISFICLISIFMDSLYITNALK